MASRRGSGRYWVAGAVCCVAPLVLAWRSAGSSAKWPAQPERSVFDAVVYDEAERWGQTLDDWAHHPWSQQDAFGALERDRVNSVAQQFGLSRQAVFRIVDDGMRAGWKTPDAGSLRVRVVPLKPRPFD